MGTSTKDFLRVSNQVPPEGKEGAVDAMAGDEQTQWVEMNVWGSFDGDVVCGWNRHAAALHGGGAAMTSRNESGDWSGNSRSLTF